MRPLDANEHPLARLAPRHDQPAPVRRPRDARERARAGEDARRAPAGEQEHVARPRERDPRPGRIERRADDAPDEARDHRLRPAAEDDDLVARDEQEPRPVGRPREQARRGVRRGAPEQRARVGVEHVDAAARRRVREHVPRAGSPRRRDERRRGPAVLVDVAGAVPGDDVQAAPTQVGDARVGVAAAPAREAHVRARELPAHLALRIERHELVVG